MVSIKDIRESNSNVKQLKSQVALFVGATSGIGKGTLRSYVKNASSDAKVYVVGRSKPALEVQLEDLRKLNGEVGIHLIEGEVSLLSEVDRICSQISAENTKLDLLFMSPGLLTFGGRKETAEGIDITQALRYYSRLRFVYQLLPLLHSSSNPRVVSILAGGNEAGLDFDDLEVKNNFTFDKAAQNGTTQTTLAFEELSKSNPDITFIHKYPGFVATGVVDRLLATATGFFSWPAFFARYTIIPVLNLFSVDPDVAGERGLFIATSARYLAKSGGEHGVPLPKGVETAKSSDSNGVYLLGPTDDAQPDSKVMPGYRKDGSSAKVWKDTLEVWSRALKLNVPQ